MGSHKKMLKNKLLNPFFYEQLKRTKTRTSQHKKNIEMQPRLIKYKLNNYFIQGMKYKSSTYDSSSIG